MAPSTRTLIAAALLLPASLYGFAAPGAARRKPSARPPAASTAPPQRLVVVFSGETNGYLTPCGCTSPMVGGFPRRSTHLSRLAVRDTLVRVDNGDLTLARGRQDELKAETLVEAMDRMNYDAIGLGERDLRLGLPYVQALAARFRGAMLCANARKIDGTPAARDFVVVRRTVGGKATRVLIAAAISEQYGSDIAAAAPDVRIEPPDVALERIKADPLAAADVRVLLYHGPRAEAQQAASRGYDLVVCAHEGDYPGEPVRAGAASVVCTGESGKRIGRAVFTSPGQPPAIAYTPLGPEFADDPAITQIKSAYLDRVTAEDLMGKSPRAPTADGDAYAGSSACKGCHAAATATWAGTGHSRALQGLAAVREDRDPECVSCHVVGFASETGYTDRERTPDLAAVGCEACHGPLARHAKDPTVRPRKAGQAVCLTCHDSLNSPKFAYAAYWARIKH